MDCNEVSTIRAKGSGQLFLLERFPLYGRAALRKIYFPTSQPLEDYTCSDTLTTLSRFTEH